MSRSTTDPQQILALEAQAWMEHHTVLVFGNVRRAVWWPPTNESPGVLAASDLDQAREALEEVSMIRRTQQARGGVDGVQPGGEISTSPQTAHHSLGEG